MPMIKEKGRSGGKKEGREKTFADSRLKVGNVRDIKVGGGQAIFEQKYMFCQLFSTIAGAHNPWAPNNRRKSCG